MFKAMKNTLAATLMLLFLPAAANCTSEEVWTKNGVSITLDSSYSQGETFSAVEPFDGLMSFKSGNKTLDVMRAEREKMSFLNVTDLKTFQTYLTDFCLEPAQFSVEIKDETAKGMAFLTAEGQNDKKILCAIGAGDEYYYRLDFKIDSKDFDSDKEGFIRAARSFKADNLDKQKETFEKVFTAGEVDLALNDSFVETEGKGLLNLKSGALEITVYAHDTVLPLENLVTLVKQETGFSGGEAYLETDKGLSFALLKAEALERADKIGVYTVNDKCYLVEMRLDASHERYYAKLIEKTFAAVECNR